MPESVFRGHAGSGRGWPGLAWGRDTLSGYIKWAGPKGPKSYIGKVVGKKRTKIKMAFPGLKKDEDIANLVAYFTTLWPAIGMGLKSVGESA